MTKILQNEVKCHSCGDNVWSAHRHDFKSCSCGKVAVDGGLDYLKRVFAEDASYTDLSISVDAEVLQALKDQLQWCEDTGRNQLGVICAILRTLRDSGYDVNPVEKE